MNQNNTPNSNEDRLKPHHVLPDAMAIKIGLTLLVFTVITVAVAYIDMGRWNLIVAMIVATIKASLVMLFFMGLKYDHKENSVIFGTSFLFLAIFFVLTGSDLFFRTEPARTEFKVASGGKFKKPWVLTPEILVNGREIFTQQCVTCHGSEGLGNGAASGTLNPKPRNFTKDADWKNGRKPSQVFGTLTKGLNQMPSFATLAPEDRWSAAYYVLSLGPKPSPDTPEDLAKVGIDPNKAGGGVVDAPTVPIDFAMERMIQE